MSYRKVAWSCQYAPALETPQSPFLYQPGWTDWVPQSVPFPTQKQQSNPRLKRLAGCVGEHFWHFSCVQTSTTILIASSTDWLKMCVVIIIFKGQSHFKQTRYVLTWSIPYFPQYDPWLWKQVQETNKVLTSHMTLTIIVLKSLFPQFRAVPYHIQEVF